MHMIESGAMISLLADCFPEKRLARCSTHLSLQRADYLQMLHFGTSWMDMILWQIRTHEHFIAAVGARSNDRETIPGKIRERSRAAAPRTVSNKALYLRRRVLCCRLCHRT
jgi:glutathione S-transferase